MPEAVNDKWQEIWDKDTEINRKYTTNFEVYKQKAQSPDSTGVEIYNAVDKKFEKQTP